MKITTQPGSPLRGSITLPGDKSISHRAALFAALAEGGSHVENFLTAGVTEAMLSALTSLGVEWERKDNALTIHGRGLGGLSTPSDVVDCGNSATTMRLLAGALAAGNVSAVLDGSSGLRQRPMLRIVGPLREMGVLIEASSNGTAPLKLRARPADQHLRPLDYRLPVASAQVKSALLLAALACDSPTSIQEPGQSRDHTERMLASMGVDLTVRNSDSQPIITLDPPSSAGLNPICLTIPGDISSAAFTIVGTLITPESEVILRGVGLNPTRTGLLDVLLEMGADIRVSNRRENQGEPIGDLTVGHSSLRGVSVAGPQVVRMIDEFPVFAVAAAFAEGQTTVRDAEELRHKESDRIAKICQELRVLGVDLQEAPDGFTINGGKPISGGEVHAHGDHRLAMALTVGGLAAQRPVTVEGVEIIAESFPGFITTLQSLGAALRHER